MGERRKQLSRTVAVAIVAIVLSLGLPVAEAKEGGPVRVMRLLPSRDGMVKLGYTYNSDADVRNEPGSFAIHMTRFAGRVPIPIGDTIVFAPGVFFDWHHFRLHNTVNYLHQNSLDVYDVAPTFDAFIRFGEDWFLSLNFTPMISSDMKGFGWDDWQFMGYALAEWAFSDSAAFIFGVAVNKEFWRYLPIPVVGFVVRSGSFFELEAVLPRYLRMDFKVASFWKIFLQGEFEGDVWHVRGDGTVPDHFGKLMETHVGAGVRLTFLEGLDMEIWGGVNPYRKAQFKDRAGLTAERRLDKAFFGQANIIITPELFRGSTRPSAGRR